MFDTYAWLLIYVALGILFALAAENPAPVYSRVIVGIFWLPILLIILIDLLSLSRSRKAEEDIKK